MKRRRDTTPTLRLSQSNPSDDGLFIEVLYHLSAVVFMKTPFFLHCLPFSPPLYPSFFLVLPSFYTPTYTDLPLTTQAALIASSSMATSRTVSTGSTTSLSPRHPTPTPMQSPQLFDGNDPFLNFPPPSHYTNGLTHISPRGTRYSPRERELLRPRASTSPSPACPDRC